MATVELKGLHKRFGKTEVIRDVDLTIEDGEFVVLIGPSGCGKSTLLRMIAGLEPISDGTISIDGKVVNTQSPRQRGISMVFQSYALYPHMTSADNMTFSLRLAGESPDVQREKLAKVADVLGLEDYLERLPRQLSGGQRQRVAMGRAIVREPTAFLFDEPLSNLDAALRVKMRGELKELHQTLKTTTIYVTHDQIEAMTLADRIVVLKNGVVEQIGSPLDLYDNPRNRFVGGFLGSPSMNFLDADVPSGEAGEAVFSDGDRIALPPSPVAPGKVVIGLRPESFALADTAGPQSFGAEVVVVEPTGADTELVMRKAGQQFVATFRERLAVRPGDTVHLTPVAGRTHLFDATTGARLD
ncbi:MAG: sn-glycerol-3-phosphate ABC transporter ATP-binding protein UgpC [Acuticoccus sp.]